MAVFDETKQDKKLEELREREAEDLAHLLAARYAIPYIDLTKFSINTDALRLISEADARTAGIALFAVSGKKLEGAIISPKNEKLKQVLQELVDKKYDVSLSIGSESSLQRAWARYSEVSLATKSQAGLIDISNEELSRYLTTVKTVNDLKAQTEEIIKTSSSHGVSRLLELVLAGAVAIGSSDIHFEPEEEGMRLRFRLDGVLQDLATLSKEVYLLLLSRIKLISSLKLNIKGSAQDGRFSIRLDGGSIEIRTSVIPGSYGETVVLRVLDPASIAISLDELGIPTQLAKIVEIEIKKPNGMVLVTGPTGSGKTTTLYAFLKKVNQSGTKIITIEDPIEYHLKGISQTQTSAEKGYTFAEGLAAALRQDPDIIMIGEIRDGETAKVAINSALTGHLVFSTLHTNTAAGAIPRLVDLGANPKVLSSAVSIALAQRLVRKLCAACKTPGSATEAERAIIEETLAGIRAKGIETPSETTIWKEQGCPVCNGTGYKGRIGIFEGVLMTGAIEKILSTSVSERDIITAAQDQKILTMSEDGVLKVLAGVTTIEELSRVIDLENLNR